VFLVIAFIATNWRKILRKITSGTAGDWTTASAKIEVVSAVEQLREDGMATRLPVILPR